MEEAPQRVRLDRWLWAARFFKTRALAKAAIDGGKIKVEGNKPKAAKEIMVGARIEVSRGSDEYTLVVTALAERRGSASVAQTLFAETAESVEQRLRHRSEQRMLRAGLRVPQTKPNKRDRRALQDLKTQSNTDGADIAPNPNLDPDGTRN